MDENGWNSCVSREISILCSVIENFQIQKIYAKAKNNSPLGKICTSGNKPAIR